ncbi:methyltransferase [Sulfolobales archaeon HS-7]|nr:methyltransferase [Sulfolobales archaeon HS-7]
MEILDVKKGERILEIGSGTGIISVYLAKLGASVVAIDVNPMAAETTQCSARINNVNVEIINADTVYAVRADYFEKIVFNPPYLPVEEYDSWLSYSWSGGPDGVKEIVKALSYRTNYYYFVYSSLANVEKIYAELRRNKIRVEKQIEKNFDFETIFAIKCIRSD